MATEPRQQAPEPGAAAGGRLGRWEWVALPELGISCMKACLDPQAGASLLASADPVGIELDGAPGMRFRVYPLPGDGRTFVLAEAPLAEIPEGSRGPRIRTLLTLGERCWPIELELVPRENRCPPLRLGPGVFDGHLDVDPGAEATAGAPRLWPVPFDPDAAGP